MKKLITILAVLFSLLVKGQTYDPTTGTVTNKPLGLNAAAATDSRSYFYSTSTFSWRPYANRAEILSYLNLAKYRTGQFDIIMDSASQKWVLYFRNGTTDADLVYKIPISIGSGTVSTGNQYQLGYYAANGTTISPLTLITGSRAVVTNSNGLPIAATTTATEIGYVNGVTSAIQTQLNTKLNISDTTNMLLPYLRKTDTTGKWVTSIFRKTASDSVFYVKGGVPIFGFKDSTGGGGGSGTVTNVATGLFLAGGPITTTGTILADSAAMSAYYLRRKDSILYVTVSRLRDSLANKQNNLQWVTATAAGLVGDSTTDNTAALQAAIDALPAVGGVLYFPAGKWRIANHIIVNKPITIIGESGPAYTVQTGAHSVVISPSRCVIYSTNATDSAFIFTVPGSQVRDISFAYSGGNAARTNTGLYFEQASDMRMTNVGFFNFSINCEIKNGLLWSINECYFVDHKRIGLKVSDSTLADGGDMTIFNNWFLTYTSMSDSATHIYYRSGGGMKILSNKFNGGGALYNPNYDIYCPFLGTVDLLINNNSFENFYKSAIFIQPQATVSMNSIMINGNQITSYQGIRNSPDIVIDATTLGVSIKGVTIEGNQMLGANSAFISDTAIYTKGVDDMEISGNTYGGYKTKVYRAASPSGNNANNIVPPYYPQILSISGGIAIWDPNDGATAVITLNQNTTIQIPNANEGQRLKLLISQDGTGGRTITFPGFDIIGTLINPDASALTIIDGYMYTNAVFIVTNIARSYPGGPLIYNNGLTTDPLFYWDFTNKRLAISASTTPSTQLNVSSDANSTANGLTIEQHALSNAGTQLLFKKSYGTRASPSVGASGNYNAIIGFSTYDGTSYIPSASIYSLVQGAISTGVVPMGIGFSTGRTSAGQDPVGNSVTGMWFSPDGNLAINKLNVDNGRKLALNGSMEIEKDSVPIVTSTAGMYVLVQDTTITADSNRIKRILPTNLGFVTGNIYTADGTLSGTRSMAGGGNSLFLGTASKLSALSVNTTGDIAFNSDDQINLNGGIQFKNTVATDANFTLTSNMSIVYLPAITANRNFIIPSNIIGQTWTIYNSNTTANIWNLSGVSSLFDAAGNLMSRLNNLTYYVIQQSYDGSTGTWRVLSKSGPSQSVTSSAGTLTLDIFVDDYEFNGTTTTWTLPTSSTFTGTTRFYIKNQGSGNITLNAGGADNLYETYSVNTITIAAGASRIIFWTGTIWSVQG